MNRRRLLQSFAVGAAVPAAEAAQLADASQLAEVSQSGLELTEDRRKVMQKVLPHRQANLRAVRQFTLEDDLEPAFGFDS